MNTVFLCFVFNLSVCFFQMLNFTPGCSGLLSWQHAAVAVDYFQFCTVP